MTVTDLSDERRENKPWLPADDRDVTTGMVLEVDGLPHCKSHGAMNRVDPVKSLWRCSEFRCGVGAEVITDGESPV